MDINKIIIGPLLTEKGSVLTESLNKYLFKVEKASNKIEIKKAIENEFNVKVEKAMPMAHNRYTLFSTGIFFAW